MNVLSVTEVLCPLSVTEGMYYLELKKIHGTFSNLTNFHKPFDYNL